jgi:hypothetical protein
MSANDRLIVRKLPLCFDDVLGRFDVPKDGCDAIEDSLDYVADAQMPQLDTYSGIIGHIICARVKKESFPKASFACIHMGEDAQI